VIEAKLLIYMRSDHNLLLDQIAPFGKHAITPKTPEVSPLASQDSSGTATFCLLSSRLESAIVN
jgi:hypothetical protein